MANLPSPYIPTGKFSMSEYPMMDVLRKSMDTHSIVSMVWQKMDYDDRKSVFLSREYSSYTIEPVGESEDSFHIIFKEGRTTLLETMLDARYILCIGHHTYIVHDIPNTGYVHKIYVLKFSNE